MRTTIDLDPHLLQRLRDEAHRRGIPFKQLLAATLRRGLDEAARPRGRYRCPTHAMGASRVDVGLDSALRVPDVLNDGETVRKLKLRR
ncbi:MAG: DUF2191 domain-containing protein [Gemmatimonadaceae bacterium]